MDVSQKEYKSQAIGIDLQEWGRSRSKSDMAVLLNPGSTDSGKTTIAKQLWMLQTLVARESELTLQPLKIYTLWREIHP